MSNLPYRPCVGIMLLNATDQIWCGERIAKYQESEEIKFAWQMPQGGIDEGEDIEAAALRELYEETGARKVEVIAQTAEWLTYDLPAEMVGKALKGKYRGQKQKWFALRFLGADVDFDITGERTGHQAEFSNWRWVQSSQVVDITVPFKRDVYRQVLKEFSHLFDHPDQG